MQKTVMSKKQLSPKGNYLGSKSPRIQSSKHLNQKIPKQQLKLQINSLTLQSPQKMLDRAKVKSNPSLVKSPIKLVQKKFQVAYSAKSSDKSVSPSPKKKDQLKIETVKNNIINVVHEQPIQLEMNSRKGSDQSRQRNSNSKKQNLIVISPLKSVNSRQSSQFLLPFNEKFMNLQKKSNKLIQKVLAIQQQIQKYAQVQQKQLRPINMQAPSSPLLQTRSLLHSNQSPEMDPIQNQHHQNLRKMNILGKNKVKMIQNLQNHIQNLQTKLMDKQHTTQPEVIEQEKKQLDNKFVHYYKHKNDILKQSKSEKFSFRHLKYLTKQSKFEKSQAGDQVMENVQGKENQESLQTQLRKLKEQFSSYQQRTSKQLQNYKERLNENILQKEMLKKQLEREKYENLKQKLFNKNRAVKSSRYLAQQKTSRQNTQSRLNLDYRHQDPLLSKLQTQIQFPKTDRPTNDQQPQFQDLQQFKDELSMKYIQQNYQIQELHQKIKQMDQIITDLKSKLDKNYTQYLAETQDMRNLLDQKERIMEELAEMNEHKDQDIEDLKNQINDMNNYILHCKEENETQNQEIQEYKNVIEEFVEEVKTLRNQLSEKNHLNDQLHQQIQEATKINKLCEDEIVKLQKQNQSLKENLSRVQNQLKLKKATQRYTQAVNRNKQSKNQSIQTSFTQTSSAMDSKINELKVQHWAEVAKLRAEFQNFLKQKQTKVQQLEESLILIKSEISNKVDQQVNEGIRTFLRYRKHTNHIVHETVKIAVHSRKILTADKIQSLQFDLNFKDITLDTKARLMTSRTTISSSSENLTLRKLIDTRFGIRQSKLEMQLPFKIHICLKLISFAVQLLAEQSTIHESTKSLKSHSSKNLLSLLPESIAIVESNNLLNNNPSEASSQSVSLQARLQKLEKNFQNYQLVYVQGNKKEAEKKKDKSLVYLSPQVLLSMNESEHSYCWTLGIIIDEIFNNKPFYTKIEEIVSRKDNYKYTNANSYPSQISDTIKGLLEKMLKKNFKERPSIEQVHSKLTQLLSIQ